MESETKNELLTQSDVLNILKVSRQTLYRLRKDGDFVPDICISARRLAFDPTALGEWIAQRSTRS